GVTARADHALPHADGRRRRGQDTSRTPGGGRRTRAIRRRRLLRLPLLACTFPGGRLDPALRRPGLPKPRRATTKVTWFLLWPDFHRRAIMSFQDALGRCSLKVAACSTLRHTSRACGASRSCW